MKAEEDFIFEVNYQILNLICKISREDQVISKLLFGLPASLVSQLIELNPTQIDFLSHTQGCLLTLRSCADELYWQKIITGSEKSSADHVLNLKALSMIRVASNELISEGTNFNMEKEGNKEVRSVPTFT